MPPRVLFGTRTSDPAALSDARPMRQHAREQGAAIAHATVEAADGGSCLRFARTLVFTHGAVASIPGVGKRPGRRLFTLLHRARR
jgi:hypothetical protein